ncbi:MAG: hypothetical protein AAEJ57_00760 [Opitutales bacterium]
MNKADPSDDGNRTSEPSKPVLPAAKEPVPPAVEENNASLPQPEAPEPVEPEEPGKPEETIQEPEEKPEPKVDRLVDPDLVGELADALQQLPDFKDKKTLKELLAEAVDQKELQSRSEGGKQRFYQDDLLFVGWIKQMRGNTQSPISLGFYLNGERSGPWASWYGSRKLKEMGLFDEGRKDGLYVTWYGSGKKKGASIYKDDLRHGFSTTWNGSGRKSAEGGYKDGKKDGLWITYDGSGRERQRVTYKNGAVVRD